MQYKKLTLFQFQEIEAINNKNLDDLDKVLYTTCAVFKLTEYQLDNMNPKKAGKLILQVSKLFESPFTSEPCEVLNGYQVNYNPSDLTFGQYIELAFFSQDKIRNAHYILASIVSSDAETHRQRADEFLSVPVAKALGTVSKFIEQLNKFNSEYNSLFEVDGEVTSHQFNKRYGWIYSASQVAEYERIKLEEAYKLPIRRALNDLAYLKAKDSYELELSKRK